MRTWLLRSLFAIPFAFFLLLNPLFTGQRITWWNVFGFVAFLVLYYFTQARRDRKDRQHEET